MLRYECSSCSKNLNGYPKIRVKGEIYCYSCAKRIVATLDRPAEEKQQMELDRFREQSAIIAEWKNSLKSSLPSGTTQKVIVVGAAVSCAVLMGNPIFFLLPGLVVGLIVNLLYYDSQKKNWIRQNPQPNYPSLSSIDFVRNHIELVGGVSGTPLSSAGYRQKILERDAYQCQTCGRVFAADQLEVHHIKPRANGGKHYAANLVTLCYHCHVQEIWFGHKHKKR